MAKNKLAVIIVNYNVKYFLEQCLNSVIKASENLAIETFVVDNNSQDNSVEMVRRKFPTVKVIANKDNKGFSYANNQAIKQSDADYVLLLNPDTVVEEDTFRKTIDFFDNTPDCGGLTVKMIDGKGNFLPESKRGLPTPEVGFYKVFGLSSLFPKSKRFGKYHLGYLEENKTHPIDVLSGAYMMMRKSALDKVGLLDESFFMYGEDIDLSYRITLGGYKNYYFPETKIIHYKGESTKKSSINYVFVFYRAMIIFAQKHFSHKNARFFSFFINIAIYLRALLAIVSRFAFKISIPVIETGIHLIILWGLIYMVNHFSEYNFAINLLAYLKIYVIISLTFLVSFLYGAYKQPIDNERFMRAQLTLFLLLTTIFTFFNYHIFTFYFLFFFSQLVLSTSALLGFRWLLKRLDNEHLHFKQIIKKRILIVGSPDEINNAFSISNQFADEVSFAGFIALNEKDVDHDFYIGNMDDLRSFISKHKIDEVIFCAKDLSSHAIINKMEELKDTAIDFKILPVNTAFLIGSNSIEIKNINQPQFNSLYLKENMQIKRTFDVLASVAFSIALPVLIFITEKPVGFIKNIFSVLFARKTWVGYSGPEEVKDIPMLKKGILSPLNILNFSNYQAHTIHCINKSYAFDYSIYNDFSIILRGIKKLGNN